MFVRTSRLTKIVTALGVLLLTPVPALLLASSADAASGIVPLTVSMVDTAGQGVSGVRFGVNSWANTVSLSDNATTNAAGVATMTALPDSTTSIWIVSGPSVADDDRPVLDGAFVINGVAGTKSVHVGTTPVTETIVVPELRTRTFHVVTSEGEPVSLANVSVRDFVSTAVTQPDGTSLRMLHTNRGPYSHWTDTDGTAQMTTYAMETDPTVADQWFSNGSHGQMGLAYNPTPTSQLSTSVPFAEWATPSYDTSVVLPFAATVTDTTSQPGEQPGEAEVTATLVQPHAAATQTTNIQATSLRAAAQATNESAATDATPIANQQVQLWAQPTPTSPRQPLATATTNANGTVLFTANLSSPTRVVVGLPNQSFVAGVTVATPRPRGPVRFSGIRFNPAGADTASRASLNGEWFKLTNSSTRPRGLTGWTVRDAAGHAYRFGSYTLPPHTTVRVHTGPGTNTRTDRYWGRTRHTWGNRVGTAALRTKVGATIDTCRWTTAGTGFTTC